MTRARWPLSLGLCCSLACAWWMAGRPGIGGGDRLTFSHALHGENDVECESCHDGVTAAGDTSGSFLPSESACMECHDRDDCGMCHSDAERRRPRPPPTRVSALRFSHVAHLESRVDKGCATCHQAVISATELPVAAPSMSTCLGCHGHANDWQNARCDRCHTSLASAPLRAVAEFEHSGDWLARHGMLARADGATCQQCHGQPFCTACHSDVAAASIVRIAPELVTRDSIHRGDFATSHPMLARAESDTCMRCHAPQSCQDCHRSVGLTPESVSGGQLPHPAGYAMPGGPVFHGDEARRQPAMCAACHDQGAASNCVECHRVGGIGGNPHPPGWKTGGGVSRRESNPMCGICHAQ